MLAARIPMEPQDAIDAFITRFFGAFDNRDGRRPAEPDIAALFVDEAIILHHRAGETTTLTVSEFARPRVALLASGALRDFREWETSAATTIRGMFASRVSTYEKAGVLDSQPYAGRGTKLFQLVKQDGAWHIASLCWYDDGEE